ncbi:MAG: Ig-like domain-containing protein, partial [Myxococcaceae bacterium]
NVNNASAPLAGAVASVALEHLEVRGTVPREGEVVALSVAPRVLLTDLPDPSTASQVTLETGGTQVAVTRRVKSDPGGGALELSPSSPLAPSANYLLRIGAGLADLQGGSLGVEAQVHFRSAATASTDAPVVDRATPAFGLEAGGEQVVVAGSGFSAGCAVRIGGAVAFVQSVGADGTSITVTAPAGDAGLAAIEVTNPSGLSFIRLGAYRYLVQPQIHSIVPPSAAFSRRGTVVIHGDGFYAGSQVRFGGVAAVSSTLDDSGALSVVVPDGVTGVVDVSVSTPGAGGSASALAPGAFTFTLASLAQTGGGMQVMRPVGSALLVARNGSLEAFDLTVPESPSPLGSVAGVAGATAMAVAGTAGFLAGGGQVVHYDLGTCGTAPFAYCVPSELDRFALTPPGATVTAVAATPGAAYLAVGGGTELALLGQVAGQYAVVARDWVASGTIRALETVPGALVILIDDSSGGRVEFRGLQSGSLPLLGTVGSLPSPVSALAAQGGAVAVAVGDGVRLLDAALPSAPVDLGAWTAGAAFGGSPTTLALAGPWIFAANSQRAAWLDTSSGIVQRTFVALPGLRQVAISSGVAVAATSLGFTVFELPYPVVTAQHPQASGTLQFDGFVSVSLSTRLPLSVASGTTLRVLDGAAVVAGTSSTSAATVRYQPLLPLTVGHRYQAQVTFGATPFVGGTVLGPWTYGFQAGPAPSALRVDAVSPGFGDVGGGTTVLVSGSGFDATSEVFFGGVLATQTAAPTATQVTVVAPAAAAAGPALVRVSNSSGDGADLSGGFVYIAPLTLTQVIPAAVDLSGGWVKLSGTGFTRGLGVSFDGVPAITRNFVGSTIEALVPGGAAGPVTLGLTQAGAAPLVAPGAVTRRDLTPPVVVAWSPLDQVANDAVPLSATFIVSFNKPIDPSTASAVRLVGSNALDVAGTRSTSADGLSISFDPASPLAGTASYTLLVSGVADLSGNVISSGHRSFRTVDLIPPVVSLSVAGSSQPIAAGTPLAAGALWEFVFTATDDSNQVSQRTLTVDGVPLVPLVNSPFTYTWPASAAGTSSTLVARATDNAGNSAEFRVVIQVVGDQPPACSFTAPSLANLGLEEGATLAYAVSVTDDHLVSTVEVLLDGVPLKRAENLMVATSSLTGSVRLSLAGSAAEQHTLSARATDERGQGGTCTPLVLDVGPDATAPAVSLLEPAGSHVLSGTAVRLTGAASDLNGISSITFSAAGSDLVTLTAPPWTTRWTAPAVTASQAVTVGLRARDPRGNEAVASLSLTVDPPSAKPTVAITAPSNGASFQEGSPVVVTLAPAAQAGLASVEVQLDTQTITLTGPPWTHTFTAPPVAGTARAMSLSAAAIDAVGARSSTALTFLTVTDDGRPAPSVSLVAFPRGPLFLGGSSLQVASFSDGGVGTFTALVGGVAAGSGSVPGTARFTLPLSPDDAGVQVLAQVTSPGGDPGTAQLAGSLVLFARGPAGVQADVVSTDVIAGLAVEGDRLLVLRGNGGGAGTLELRARADASLVATAPLTGTPAGVAFAGGQAAVALRHGGAGSVRLFSLPALTPGTTVALRRAPAVLARLGGRLAVGTDEGLEVRDAALHLVGRLPLGAVGALSADGDRLYALAGGQLWAIDASLPYAPQVLAATPAPGATAVTALAGRACTAGTSASCYTLSAGAFAPAQGEPLSEPALSVAALGPWLIAGGAGGLRVFDARAAPASAGYFPAVAGAAVASGGDVFAARAPKVLHLGLGRGQAAPAVSLGLPASAAPGARVALGASVADGADPLNAYTAELLVDGTVVEVLDSRVPLWVDLPATGSSALVVLRVRDLAGNLESAQAVLPLVDDGQGPALASLQMPSDVLSATVFTVTPVGIDPQRVAAVEVTLGTEAPLRLEAPALTAALVAPTVSIDTAVTLSAVAIDALGRRGAPVSAQLWVHPDPTPATPVVSLARVGSGAIFEGASVAVLAGVTSIAATHEVRFSVDGAEQQVVAASPFEAALRMPIGTGTRTVIVQATAIDAQGRASAPAGLSLTVVDDLVPPAVSLTVEPTGTVVAAGSRLTAAATAQDWGGVDSLSLQLSLNGSVVASAGSSLSFDVPASTPEGATLEVLATVTDLAGNAGTARAIRTVIGPVLPAPGSVVVTSLADASAVALLGDLALAVTPQGLSVNAIVRGAAPTFTQLALYPTPKPPAAVALRGTLAVLARGADGLDVIDLSTPSAPVAIAHLAGTFTGVAVGDSFYASSSESEVVKRLDLSDPARPVLTDSPAEGKLLGAGVDGPLAVHGTSLEVGYPGIYGPAAQLLAVGSLPAAAAWEAEILVVGTAAGITTYLNQYSRGHVELGSLPLPAAVRHLSLAGGLAYLACADGQLRVVDIRDPRQLAELGTSALDAQSLTVSGGVLIASTSAGVVLRPLPGPAGTATVAKATMTLADLPQGLTAYRRGLLAAATTAGVQSADLGISTGPVGLGPVVPGTSVKQVERVGSTVFYLDGNSLLAKVEVANGTLGQPPGNMTWDLQALGNVQRFAVAPDRVWSVAGGALKTLSLSTRLSKGLVLGTSTVDVAGDESRAVVALGSGGFAVVGVDPTGGAQLLSTVAASPVSAVALDGNLAVVGSSASLSLYDLSNAAAPAFLGSAATQGAVRRIRLAGRLALVSEGTSGVEVWDLTTPASPARVEVLPAGRAEDAIALADALVVSDGLAGLVVFGLPATSALPSAHLATPGPGATAEAGQLLDISGATSGLGVDDAELLVDGVPTLRLGAASPRARWRVPPDAVVGSTMKLELRARAPGRQALSPPRLVRVTGTTTAAPMLTLNSPWNASLTSGQAVFVQVSRTGGLGPFSATVRYGQTVLGSLQTSQTTPSLLEGDVQMPLVSADVTESLVVDLTDAASRTATVSRVFTLEGNPNPPSTPTGFPAKLRAQPVVNTVSVMASSAGAFTLRLERDGVVVASRQAASGALAVQASLTFPASAVGSSVTLTAVAEDVAGRTSTASRTYTVLPDHDPPVVSFVAAEPPVTAEEGTTVLVRAQATTTDQLDSFVLNADGSPIATSATGTVSATHVLPLLAQASQVVFTAVATDSTGLQTTVSTTTTLSARPPPVVSFAANQPPGTAPEGSTVHLQAQATTAGQIASFTLTADGTPLATSTTGTVSADFVLPLLSQASEAVFEALATDEIGRQGSLIVSTTLTADPPPVLTFTANRTSFLIGELAHLCVQATDETAVTQLEGTIDGVPLIGAPVSCGARCLSRCLDYPVPAQLQVVLQATATDSIGHMTSGSQSWTVSPNQAPVVTVVTPPAMLVNSVVQLSGTVADERSPLAWAEFRINGQPVGQRVLNPASGSTVHQLYVPTQTGTLSLELVAQDSAGLQGSAPTSFLVGSQPTDITEVIAADDLRFEGADIIIQGKTLRIDGTHSFNSISVLSGGVLTHTAQTTTGMTGMDLHVTAGVTVDSSSRIDATARGYLGGYSGGNADPSGRTTGNVASGVLNATGSYGGFGRSTAAPAAYMATYGDYRDPNDLGSGGASSGAVPGGNGGGLVRISAQSLQLNGQLNANGQDGAYPYFGGSGGGIKLDVQALSGTGTIAAAGGYSGGGGGRVAILYGSNNGFNFANVRANSYGAGGAGTVFLKSVGQTYGELLVDNSNNGGTVPGTAVSGTLDKLTVAGNAGVDATAGLAIMGAAPVVLAGSAIFGAISAPNATSWELAKGTVSFTQPWSLPAGIALSVTGGGTLSVAGGAPLALSSLTLTNGVLTQPPSTSTTVSTLQLNVTGAVVVDASSRIDVTGKGYLGGLAGGNPDATGRTVGNVPSGVASAGGSYGGYGRRDVLPVAHVPTYGDFKDPNDVGSGGAQYNASYYGGNGGGLVRISAQSLQLNGQLLASGLNGPASY